MVGCLVEVAGVRSNHPGEPGNVSNDYVLDVVRYSPFISPPFHGGIGERR